MNFFKPCKSWCKKTLSIPSPNQNSVNLKWLKRLSQGCQLSHYQAAKKNMKVDLFCKPEITISNAKLITKSTRYFGREFYHHKQTSWPEISYIKLCVTCIHAVTQWSEPLVFMVNSGLIMFEGSSGQIYSCLRSNKRHWSKILPKWEMVMTNLWNKLSNERFWRKFGWFLAKIRGSWITTV